MPNNMIATIRQIVEQEMNDKVRGISIKHDRLAAENERLATELKKLQAKQEEDMWEVKKAAAGASKQGKGDSQPRKYDHSATKQQSKEVDTTLTTFTTKHNDLRWDFDNIKTTQTAARTQQTAAIDISLVIAWVIARFTEIEDWKCLNNDIVPCMSDDARKDEDDSTTSSDNEDESEQWSG